MQAFLQNQIHTAAISERPHYPDPHDISAEIRVLNWLTDSVALAEKVEAEMSTSKDCVCLPPRPVFDRECQSLEDFQYHSALLSNVKRNESPGDSFSEGSLQILGIIH